MQVNIQDWLIEQTSKQELSKYLYADNWGKNIHFIRDTLGKLFNTEDIKVISEHRSKSLICPVIKLDYKNVTMVFQFNFYDWQIMIKSPDEIIFTNVEDLEFGDYLFYQGIPEQYQFSAYSNTNTKTFAVDLPDDCCRVYAFFVVLKMLIDKNNIKN